MADDMPLSPGPSQAHALGATTALSAPLHDPAATDAFLATCSAATQALHADHALRAVSDVAAPLHVATTFRYPEDPDQLVPQADATHSYPPPGADAHVYSRHSSPNLSRLEALLSALLGAPALAYGSGLAAAHALYAVLRPRRVFITDGYHGVHGVLQLLGRVAGGAAYTRLPLSAAAAQCGAGDVLHVETPLNPTGEARALTPHVALARERGAVVVVDATLAPPPLQDPLALGVDAVLHSGTKYLGGHSDLLLGVLATRHPEWLAQLAADRVVLGGLPGNMESWLAARSLRSLGARITRQSASAGRLVAWLHAALDPEHPVPGAAAVPPPPHNTSSPAATAALRAVLARVQHSSVQAARDPEAAAWLAAQMPTGGGGAVFALTATAERFARRLPGHLHLFAHATSLGGVESLIEWRAMSDAGVDRCLLRVSVGMEEAEDLWRDLVQACEALVREKKVE